MYIGEFVSRLMQAERRMNELVKRTMNHNSANKPSLKKHPLFASIENSGGGQYSNLSKGKYSKSKNEAKTFPPLPPFPYN